jgi:hypothetical protein
VCSSIAEMGFGHVALCTVTVVVLCAMMVSSSSSASRTQLVFESSRSQSPYGPLKQQASPQQHSYTRVTKLPSLTNPVINAPTISITNGTSNDTVKIEVCTHCVCICLYFLCSKKRYCVIV